MAHASVPNYQAIGHINGHGVTYSGDDTQTPLGLKADEFAEEEVSESRQRNTRFGYWEGFECHFTLTIRHPTPSRLVLAIHAS